MKTVFTASSLVTAIAILSSFAASANNYEYQYHQRLKGLEASTTQPTQPSLPALPEPEMEAEPEIIWYLDGAALPRAMSSTVYNFSFSTLIQPASITDLTWSALDLPEWATLDTLSGSLSGTPSRADIGSSPFTIIATRVGAQQQQIYTIEVGGQLLDVSHISAGAAHTCAVTTAGAAMCWGANAQGQLGDGTTTERSLPVQVSGLGSGVARIEASASNTCAVTSAGAALCWGNNAQGQVGDGTKTNRLTPVQVTGLSSGVVSAHLGAFHACAVTSAGAALCWGNGSYGQLGTGKASSLIPETVSGLSSGVTRIASGDYHVCAVVSGAARCWGTNDRGQLGDGTTANKSLPVAVSGLAGGVSDISVGAYHTCAVTSGSAQCWGANHRGMVGDGTLTNRSVPTQVSGLGSGVASIEVGDYHSCAVTMSGAALCWGNNDSMRVGDSGNNWGTITLPFQLPGLNSGVSQISAGGSHTCAISAGFAKCWGNNQNGRLGIGSTSQVTDIVDVITGL